MTVADDVVRLAREVVGGELPIGVRAWDGSEVRALDADAPVLVLRSRRALRHLVWSPGELGLARAYVVGDLDVDGDLEDGLRRVWAVAGTRGRVTPGRRERLGMLATAARLGALGPPPRRPASEAERAVVGRGRLHSPARDRAVIEHHYDLSNDFYELVLDEHMAYSCAYFTDAGQSLADAQRTKLELVCQKLQLAPGKHLLDVGCGWGSLSLHAARVHGARVTGITLSSEQRDFVRKRIAEAGVQHLVDVELRDYRELAPVGSFDAVASIEMGEHVGEERYPEFLARLRASLRTDGRLLVQQMSRPPGAPGGGPFIEAFIAPDMHMRPLGETVAHVECAGFEVRHVEAMREHYARTGRAWSRNLDANWSRVVELVGAEVARVWQLYLAGGTLAFAAGRMGVDQILAVRAR
jgi:cyclopropane-fatty-acyl-phospholipid synthase